MRITAARMVAVAMLLFAMAGLSQCAPRPFTAPSVLAGSDATVSIKAGTAVEPVQFAADYCARFGKISNYAGSTVLNETDLTRLYVYDCVYGHPR